MADAITRLNELKSRGVDTIVDLTVIGLGRYIPRIARVAAATELNIVVATGLYTYNDVPFYFHYLGPGGMLDGPEIMTDMFVRDIEQGIADTGVKAGILKCATDEPGVTPGVERVLRAVAQAHKRTGVPISTHTHAGLRRGLEQQRIFEEEGVDLSRVIIGHSGDSTDVGYLEELIAPGSYLGMDRFGIDVILPFEDRVNIVATMCERGHADKMVLSHDANCYFDALPEESGATDDAELALPAHPQRRDSRAQGARCDRRAAAHHAGRQPAPHLRAAGRLSNDRARPADRHPDFGAGRSSPPTSRRSPATGARITRGELDRSTNRLARAYAERGVGVGDYVTIVLPNSIEWIQAAVACWKLGAVPQPLSARLPDAEFEGLLDLRPRALLVGRDHPGTCPVCQRVSSPTGRCPTARCRKRCRRCWKSMGSGGSTGRPKLIEAGGDSRIPAAIGYATGRAGGRYHPGAGAAQPQHRLHHRDDRFADAPPSGADEPVRPARVPAADHRASRHVPDDGADDHAAGATGLPRRSRTPTTCHRSGGSGTSARRARRPSSRRGSTCWVPKRSGNCTAAPNFRR